MNMAISLTGLLGIGLVLALAVTAVIVVVIIIVTRRSDAVQEVQQIPQPIESTPSYEQTDELCYVEPKPQTLGEVIKSHRIRCGMTQEYVAEALEVSRQAVSKWETDSSDPSTSNLLALAKLFGISAAELLDGIEQQKS